MISGRPRCPRSSASRANTAGDDIADGVDAGHIGAVVRIDRDAAAIVDLDAGRLRGRGLAQARGRWRRARHRPRSSSAAPPWRLEGQPPAPASGPRVDRCDLRRQFEGDALLLQEALATWWPNSTSTPASDAIRKVLNHGDLGAEPPPHRAKFQPDHAGADDQQPARHLVESQRAFDDTMRFSSMSTPSSVNIEPSGDDDVLFRASASCRRRPSPRPGRTRQCGRRRGRRRPCSYKISTALDVAVDSPGP